MRRTRGCRRVGGCQAGGCGSLPGAAHHRRRESAPQQGEREVRGRLPNVEQEAADRQGGGGGGRQEQAGEEEQGAGESKQGRWEEGRPGRGLGPWQSPPTSSTTKSVPESGALNAAATPAPAPIAANTPLSSSRSRLPNAEKTARGGACSRW
eukprot:648458-Prymnesium_polylepis.2